MKDDYKFVKRQLKLLRGLKSAPGEHRARLEGVLAALEAKTGLSSEEQLVKRLDVLKHKREEGAGQKGEVPKGAELRCWYLRPLLSHLDHPGKITALFNSTMGFSGLKAPVKLHIPCEDISSENEYQRLHRYFSFKALGKGAPGSRMLEKIFYNGLEHSNELPFTVPGLSDLPNLHYNLEQLWQNLELGGQQVTLVSGLCPLSIISNELLFDTTSGESFRPAMGFEPLEIPPGQIEDIWFPPRPILSDYIELTRVFSTAKALADNFGSDSLQIKLWLPYQEYLMALQEETLVNFLEREIIDIESLGADLTELSERYAILVEAVRAEQGYDGVLDLEVTDPQSLESQQEQLEEVLGSSLESNVDRYVPLIYGLYKGTPLRKTLFALLAFKHLQPMLENDSVNVLHLENSYEVWPTALATSWVERWFERAEVAGPEQPRQFAWLCWPSVPSPSLKYMRALNAPYEHKLYLAADSEAFEAQLELLQPKYIKLISVLVPGLEETDDERVLRTGLQAKLWELQKIF